MPTPPLHVTSRILLAVRVLGVLFLVGSSSAAADLRTINVDFGSGPLYSGDDGLLSSPGGTAWNSVRLSHFGFSQPLNPPGVAYVDEFDEPADEFFLWRSATATNLVEQTGLTAPGQQTSSMGVDGIHTTTLSSQLVIRGVPPTSAQQTELVLYFTQADFLGSAFGARRYMFLDTENQPLGQGDVQISPTSHGYAAHITAPPLTQVPFAGPSARSPFGYFLRIDEGLTLTGLQLRTRFAVPEPGAIILAVGVAGLGACRRRH